jgi:hypothetical protein
VTVTTTSGEVNAGSPSILRPLFAHLLDDAAIFPPGNAPMGDAVRDHLAHRAAPYADLVGPFVCSDDRLDELITVVTPHDVVLDVSVVVRAGVEGVPAAVGAVRGAPALRLAAVDVPAARADDEIGEVVAAFDRHLPESAAGYVEVPVTRPDLEALRASRYGVKLRTGGTAAAAFPSEGELALALHRVVGAGLTLKCTAGLHHAVRHLDLATGFEHHGFLNVLLAVDAARRGAAPDDLAAVLAERDQDELAGRTARLTAAEVGAIRRTFACFGTCSVSEPVEDLTALGLL